MPATFATTRTIAAPTDRVFDAMTDPDQIRAWMPGLVAFEVLTEGPIASGSRWRETRRVYGKEASEVFEVTECEPPRALGLLVDGSQGSAGKGLYRFRYDLEPLDEPTPSTRLTLSGEIDMGGGIAGLFSRLMVGMFRKMCDRDLKEMARHVEQETFASAGPDDGDAPAAE